MKQSQVEELLYQALETEIGGQKVYEAAIRCAQNDDVRKEWGKYLDETRTHEQVLRETFRRMGLDAEKATPGRVVVRHKGAALVEAMEMALQHAGPAAAQLVAAESIVEAETKDHQNWELIGKVAESIGGDDAAALAEAHGKVEDQEDEHLYHTMGWARELWIDSLGMPAVLPPPEEAKKVETAIGAARAKQSRDEMLPKARRATKKKAARKPAAKRSAAKKAAKRPAAKKAAAKRPGAKKAAAKRPASKKVATKRSAAKKAAAKSRRGR